MAKLLPELDGLIKELHNRHWSMTFSLSKTDNGQAALTYTIKCEHGHLYGCGGVFDPAPGFSEAGFPLLVESAFKTLGFIEEDHKKNQQRHGVSGMSLIDAKHFAS